MVAAQNNVTRTNYIKAKIDYTNRIASVGYVENHLMVGCLFCFYGNSTFVGYLMPNPFYTNNQFYFKQFNLAELHSLIVKNISISSYSV